MRLLWYLNLIHSSSNGPLLVEAQVLRMFFHLLLELACGGSELSKTIGMIAYAPTHLVEALLFWSDF